ncbi:hypothetical protein MBLNU459_g8382t1 [Dothideomycetes sp. NU459]
MQGFNMGRYVPPDLEGTISANKLAGKHALGARANKISQGILTVRFEMPFAVWCNHCPKPTIIGQGVRFNAEKKKVGNYLSTPILSFRMKHAACGGWIEIRTDPKNTAYVVTEGGKQRDTGEDRIREGEDGVPILTAEERERRREDAFAALEGKKEEQVRTKENSKRIQELYEARDRDWEDPYAASRRLRNSFRAERKVRVKEEEATEKLRDSMGLDVELVPENEDDRRQAALVDFGVLDSTESDAMKATSKPLFPTRQASRTAAKPHKVTKKVTGKAKAAAEAERRRTALQQELQDNSRAAVDPFLSFGSLPKSDNLNLSVLSAIKRRSGAEEAKSTSPAIALSPGAEKVGLIALVSYDSD